MRFVGRFLEKGIKIYLVGRFLSFFFFNFFWENLCCKNFKRRKLTGIHLKYTILLPSEKGEEGKKKSKECRLLKNFKYAVTVST